MKNISVTELSGYMIPLQIGSEFITIRNASYMPEAINPNSSGRFHVVGQPAYYLGSGNATTMLEKDLDPTDNLPSNLKQFSMSSGLYNALDLSRFINDHPEYEDFFYGINGWTNSQELRNTCQSCDISGIYYDSIKNAGGKNLAIWPLLSSELNSDFFQPAKTH